METEPKKINLLFVDDEEQFLLSTTRRLEARGFNVIAVTRGYAAVEAAKRQSVDVALVDLKMPGMDGEHTLWVLKADSPLMEVIILTGHGSIDSAVLCTGLGAYSYLEKPCEWERLIKTIMEAYKRRVMNKAKIDEARLNELLDASLSESPLAILRKLRELDGRLS